MGLPCQAAPGGTTVEIDEDTDYEPDALINCGPPIPDDATAAPNPVVIVEVLSPSTATVDAGGKLADYFRLASVRHYGPEVGGAGLRTDWLAVTQRAFAALNLLVLLASATAAKFMIYE